MQGGTINAHGRKDTGIVWTTVAAVPACLLTSTPTCLTCIWLLCRVEATNIAIFTTDNGNYNASMR